MHRKDTDQEQVYCNVLLKGNRFGLLLYVPVNIYGNFETVSLPNHISPSKLGKAFNLNFVHIILLVTGNKPS